MAPLASVVMAVLWWMVLLATRYTSVASITASLALPPLVLVFGGTWAEVFFTLGAAIAIIVLHRANIERLRHGTENRFTLRLPRLHRHAPAPVAASDPVPPVR
jgi:glycerol-3-phosphate acyltransferase PlsY